MDTRTAWTNRAEALAFIGNSLLAPMNQTSSNGIDPGFWNIFPDFGDEDIRMSVKACKHCVELLRELARDESEAIARASIEYTRLFIGPPRPEAAPWETMYRQNGNLDPNDIVGFGQATFEMQALLREAGLVMSNENNQYADHMGIELLYASTLCSKVASAQSADCAMWEAKAVEFLERHPLAWISKLICAVRVADRKSKDSVESFGEAGGYIFNLLSLAENIMKSIARQSPAAR